MNYKEKVVEYLSDYAIYDESIEINESLLIVNPFLTRGENLIHLLYTIRLGIFLNKDSVINKHKSDKGHITITCGKVPYLKYDKEHFFFNVKVEEIDSTLYCIVKVKYKELVCTTNREYKTYEIH